MFLKFQVFFRLSSKKERVLDSQKSIQDRKCKQLYTFNKLANEYGDNNRAFRYIAKNVVTVCTSDVDKVLALMSNQADLLKKGVVVAGNDWENPVEFKYEGLNEIKPQMIEEATKNAREVAEKFAKDSDSKIGKIKSANQGTFSIEARDSNTPYIKRVRVVTSVTYYLNN